MRNFLILFVLLLSACGMGVEEKEPEGFVADTMLRITPVKDQGKSELCWAFAMLATIETEHLENGDSVNLSTDFVARMVLEEQARERFDSNGSRDISMRGIGPMLLRLIRKYGAFPYDSYYSHSPVNYKVLANKVTAIVDLHLNRHSDWERCEQDLHQLLDTEIGWLPRFVFMLGAEYTPLEFAHSVYRKDEYVALSTDEDKEPGEYFVPQLTDNQYQQETMNMPADSIARLAVRSVKEHHPVFWEGGPNDNHAVVFVGLGHDREGKRFFIAKNSWGQDNPTNGMLYVPVDYVRKHTALVVVHADMLKNEKNPTEH